MRRSLVLLPIVAFAMLGGSANAATVDDSAFTLSGKKVQRVDHYTKFLTTGSAKASVSLPATTSYAFTLRGDLCGAEAPRAVLRVDGVQVGSFLADDQWRAYNVVQSLQGVHSFEVAFTNDYYEPRDAFSVSPPKPLTCDRNLHFDFLTTQDAATQPPAEPPPPSGAGVTFRADAERSLSQEWASVSCASSTRVSQVVSPRDQGLRAYRIQLNEGDNSYGERCEVAQANTSSSNIDRVMAANGGNSTLFANGTESWIAWSFYADPSLVTYCAPGSCSQDREAGLIQQLKQTGSCGTPAGGKIIRRPSPGTGWITLRARNSAETDCGNASMKSLWEIPVREGCWVRVLDHVKWGLQNSSPNAYYATWVDHDCDGTLTPVEPSLDGAGYMVTRVGDEVRIHRHTLKDGSGVDRLRQCTNNPCAHLRNGIYRNPNINGSSVMFFDGTTVAKDRLSAEANAWSQGR